MERANKSLILAKIEGTYGTDPTPAAATEAIIAYDPTFDQVGSPRERSITLAYFGKIKPINVGEALKLTFSTELKHSGTADTPSRYGPLFRACNFTETINASTSVVYTPNSTFEGESVTLYFYVDGVLHKLVGCVGTCKFSLKAGEVVMVDWEFTGLYSDNAADTAFPSPTHETVSPIIWDEAAFVYNSVNTLVIEELSLDIGNTISMRKDANAANSGISRYFVSDRDAKGSMNPERVALTTLNPWTIYDQTTQANLETKPTLSAGNKFEVVATGLVLEAPKYGNRENILTWDLSFSLNPTMTAGNNEIVITFK